MIAFEPLPEEFGEQRLIPEPAAVLVDPVQEQIPLLDALEERLATFVPGEGGGEAAADAFGDRGGEQELDVGRGQGGEHVLGEELADRPVPVRDIAAAIEASEAGCTSEGRK